MRVAHIAATGRYVPARRVTNAELESRLGDKGVGEAPGDGRGDRCQHREPLPAGDLRRVVEGRAARVAGGQQQLTVRHQ